MTATPQLRAQFAELICADPDWLAAEFESLVAASYGAPPAWPSPPAPPHVPPSGPPGSRRRGYLDPAAPASAPAAIGGRPTERHQRSPPK